MKLRDCTCLIAHGENSNYSDEFTAQWWLIFYYWTGLAVQWQNIPNLMRTLNLYYWIHVHVLELYNLIELSNSELHQFLLLFPVDRDTHEIFYRHQSNVFDAASLFQTNHVVHWNAPREDILQEESLPCFLSAIELSA